MVLWSKLPVVHWQTIFGLLAFVSFLLTNFPRPRRLISYALMIEGLTVVIVIASLFLFSGHNG